jgi:hypothetical protein
MNKRDRMNQQIREHGENLKAIFNVDMDADKLARKVHSIEVKAHRLAEEDCNTGNTPEDWDEKILKSLDKILGFKAKGIPVFVNGDPRGYALKIDDKYVREHDLKIHRDWGGYGILAPEFDGRE